jgi:DNA-directed RNA polymerase specialized sigma24 family protein
VTPLGKLKQRHAKMQRAELEYRAMLLSCIDAGFSYAQIAEALGTSRQAIRQYVIRAAA